jgi:hypothetical protein
MKHTYSNRELIGAVAAHSDIVADHFGYSQNADGTFNLTNDGKQFAAPTTVTNEFLSVLINKIVVQRNYVVLGGWENPYNIFYKAMEPMGDTEELMTVDVIAAANYSGTSSLLTVAPPTVYNSYIYTVDKKVWKVSISQPILAGAFTTEGGLSALVANIIGMLRKSKELYVYDQLTADFATAFTITEAIGTVTPGNAAQAQLAYEKIIALAQRMSLPATGFNAQGVRTNTALGSAILVLNAGYKASFDISVFASLFNADVVGEQKKFARVLVVDLPAGVLGYVMDPEAYIIVDRIMQTESFFDASNLVTTFFLHNWIKRGKNPFVNAVKLIA